MKDEEKTKKQLVNELIKMRRHCAELEKIETEHKRVEERLRKEIGLRDFLMELFEKAPSLADKELYDYALEQVVRLSDSTIGFFHLVSDDQKDVILTTWNSEALKNCTASYATHYSLDQAGNWVDCVRSKRPIVYNKYPDSPNQKGLPEGHTPIRRFMSVPVVEGEEVRIIFGVGNKFEEYDEDDASLIQVVANELQRIIGQRRAEEDLRRSEAYFRFLVEKSSGIITILNVDETVRYLSPSLEHIAGYKPVDLTGRNIFEFVHPDDISAAKDIFIRAIRNPGVTVSAELRLLHRDSSWYVHEIAVQNLLENEVVKGIVVNSHDITARKKVEGDLIRQKSQLQNLLNLYQDPDVRIRDISSFVIEECIRISESQLGFFGFINEEETVMIAHLWSEEAMKGCRVDFKPVEFSLEHAGIWAEAIREHKPLIVNDYSRPDPRKKGYPKGHVPIHRLISIPVIRRAKTVAIIVVANKDRDYDEAELLHLSLFLESMWGILERRRAEEALQKTYKDLQDTKDQLVQSEKLASIGTLASGAAHEIRNPLNIISLNLQVLEAKGKLDEATKKAADICSVQIDRIAKIVDGMRTFSRLPEKKFEERDLSEIIDHVMGLSAPRLKTEDVATEIHYDPDVPKIPIDKEAIEQVLFNLVSNALDAMKGQEKRNLRVSTEKKENKVLISISDTGHGIKEGDLLKLFDPFFTTKGPDKGTGLGLSVSYGIIQTHGGRIRAENNDEGGASFFIELPVEKREIQ